MQKNSNFKIKSDKALAKLTIEQLNNELNAAKDQLVIARENLAKDPDNTELQGLLEDLDIYSATLSDMLSKGAVQNTDVKGTSKEDLVVSDGVYKPGAGLENFIHVEIHKGSKFDPETGKPAGISYKQCYTYKQFLQLKRNAVLLGYKYKVLYVPESLKSVI